MPKKFAKINFNTLIKIRLFLSLLLLAVILSLVLARLVPSGQIFYNRNFSHIYQFFGGQGFISQFSPAERVIIKKGAPAELMADPVYFSLFTPRTFNTARLIIRYQDNLSPSTPIVEAGLLMDKVVWQYQMKPIANKILDNLAWPKVSEAGVTLYARQGGVSDLSYFKKIASERKDLALYNYSLFRPYYLSNYLTSKTARVVASNLRGPYQFYTYIDQEDLNFSFTFQDLNQNYDLKGDGVTVLVSDYQGENILTREVLDDGVIADTGVLSAKQILAFVVHDLPRGVHKIEVKTNDDILTSEIFSSASRLSFINKIWLYGGAEKFATLFTNANNLKATAFGPTGEQTLVYDQKDLIVNAPYQQFYKRVNVKSDDSLYSISLKPTNIIIENNGLFSRQADEYINPDFVKVDYNWEGRDDINYILSNYKSPTVQGQDKIAVLDFDLNNAYREKNKYSFMLSIPGLYAYNQGQEAAGRVSASLNIKEIRVELVGKSLGQKIKEIWQEKIKTKLGF